MPTHALLLPKSEVQRARHILSEKNWLVKIRDVDPCAEKTFRRAEDDSDGHTETEAAPAGCKLIEVTTVAERALISADDDAQLRELRRFVVRLEPLQPPGSSNCEAGLAEQQQSGPPPQFTFADLFCGVGGFACGLGSGGFEGLHGRCLLACERDAEARGLYLLNHGTPTFGMSDDVCSLRRLPTSLDILTGGFPCQSFSRAARDPKGFACERNGLLFFEIARLLEDFQNPQTEAPKTLLLENVGNLLHIDGGKVIEAVVAELERCGYDVTYKLLASDTIAGLAQRCERVYIVGFRKDLAGAMERFSFPEEEFAPAGPAHEPPEPKSSSSGEHPEPLPAPSDARSLSLAHSDATSDAPGAKKRAAAVRDILETPAAAGSSASLRESRLTPHQWLKVKESGGWLNSLKKRRRLVDPERAARTLTGNYRTGYLCQTEFVEWEGAHEEGESDAWVSDERSDSVDAPEAEAVPVSAYVGSSKNLKDLKEGVRRPRFFTPRECARLQGFPESFVICGSRNPNRWYHQAGNAVAPPVVGKVARRVLEAAGIIPPITTRGGGS